MLEILFRGLTANGSFVYGDLLHDKKGSTAYWDEYSQRICWDNSNQPVRNGTVDQFVGRLDEDGARIFTRDNVVFLISGAEYKGVVIRNDETCAFEIECENTCKTFNFSIVDEIKIVGNIYGDKLLGGVK